MCYNSCMSIIKQNITATVYDKKGRVLAIGRNSYIKTHPEQARIAKECGLPEKIYVHAEAIAIIRALKVGKPHKIKVERYFKNGEPALAKPCPICELFIKEAGIKFVEYTM